jgi:periplasmic protein TonB
MPSPAPPPPAPRRKPILGFSPRAWLYIAIAFAAGLLLFLAIWMKQRDANDFYRADGAGRSATGDQFEPLPGPELDGADNPGAAPAPQPADEPDEPARIVETTPAPAPQPTPVPSPAAAPDTGTANTGTAATTLDSPPVPISNPAPAYPTAALRRGESGEALLRVHVGADGVPYAIDLIRGSGSRLLDRAATDAVRKWRFRPAMSGGRPVAAPIQVPIAFNTQR